MNKTARWLLLPLILGCLCSGLHAQSLYWDPGHTPATPSYGSGTWDTSSSSWSDLTSDNVWPNTSTNEAIFGFSGGGTVTINTGSGVTANYLYIDDNYSFVGNTPADVLNMAGTTPTIVNDYGNSTISAVIAGTNGLTICGGTNTAGGAASTLNLSGNNTYTGGTIITRVAGAPTNYPITVVVNSPTALGAFPGSVTVAGQAAGNTPNTLILGGGITMTNETLTLDTTQGTAVFNYITTTAPGTWQGNIVLSGSKNAFIQCPAATNLFLGADATTTISNVSGSNPALFLQGGNGQGFINSTILGDSTNGVSLNKQTTWTINSTNNSFTGPILVSANGLLKFYHLANAGVNSSLGAGSNIVLGALGNGNTPNLTWMGSNAVNGASSDRTITLLDATSTGDIISPNYSGQTMTLNGSITTGNQSFDTLWTRGSGALVINGQITDSTANGLRINAASGGGTSLYNTNNSYRGDTIAAGSLNFLSIANQGVNSSLGAGTNVILNGSGLLFFKGTNGIHNASSDRNFLNIGGNQIRLQQSGGLVLNLSGTITCSNVSAGKSLFIRDTGSMTISGPIVDIASVGTIFSQASAGKITLSNPANSFSGQVQQTAGILAFLTVSNMGVNCSLGASPTNNIVLANSTLSYIGTATNSTDRNLEITGSNQTLSQDGTGYLIWSGNITNNPATGRSFALSGTLGNGEFDGVIQNQVGVSTNFTSLTKSGTNTWTLNGANTYSGTTTVNAGTLLVNSTIGTNTVTVNNAGSTFGGTGTVTGPVTYNSGTLAKLKIGSPLTMTKALVVAGATLPKVSVILSNNVPAGTYTLATYNTTGSSGAFDSVPVIASGSLAAGNVALVTTSGGSVVLTVQLPVGTTTTVTSSQNPSLLTSNVTFTATIAPASGAVVPTGTVQFLTNGVALGTAQTVVTGVSPNGTATISTAALPLGTTTVTAQYTATSIFSSSSGTLSGGQLVNAPVTTPPGFTAGGFSVSGGTVSLVATGAIGGTYSILTSTNLALPLASWPTQVVGTVTASPFTNSFPNSATNAHQFYLFKAP